MNLVETMVNRRYLVHQEVIYHYFAHSFIVLNRHKKEPTVITNPLLLFGPPLQEVGYKSLIDKMKCQKSWIKTMDVTPFSRSSIVITFYIIYTISEQHQASFIYGYLINQNESQCWNHNDRLSLTSSSELLK